MPIHTAEHRCDIRIGQPLTAVGERLIQKTQGVAHTSRRGPRNTLQGDRIGVQIFGCTNLRHAIDDLDDRQSFQIELSWDWVAANFIAIGKPLLLGSFISATILASTGYVLISVLWRLMVAARFRRRRRQDD